MNKLKIISTVYNAEKWVGKCVMSMITQTFTDFEAVIIDDCSTDSTYSEIMRYVEPNDERFTIIRNEKNLKALPNYINHIPKMCDDDEDIIVSIDGDDWFYTALEYINQIYNSKNVWLTYGQYITSIDLKKHNSRLGCSRPLKNIKDTRKFGVNFSHLKTWRYKLWKQIKDDDLRNQNGDYVQTAWDLPMMLPMIEMAGLDRIKYIDKLMYVYNIDNPLNEYKKDKNFQIAEDKFVRSKNLYAKIS